MYDRSPKILFFQVTISFHHFQHWILPSAISGLDKIPIFGTNDTRLVEGWHRPLSYAEKACRKKHTHTQAPLHPREVRSSVLHQRRRAPHGLRFDL